MTTRGEVASRVAWLLAWLAVAAMGALAITQALGLGSRGPLPALQSLTPLVLLPAFPIAVVAAVRNRRALALTAAGIAVALLVLTAPIVFPGDRPAPAADATRLRITFANLFRENEEPAAAAAVMAHDADVVAVVELNPVMATHLEAAGAGRYRYQLARPSFSSEGLALYSRFPIVQGDIRRIGTRLGLEARLDVDGRPIRLFVVHPFPPIFNGRLSAEWAASLAAIGDEATSPGPPTIVAGDFNASRWHPPFRRLLRHGLRDSHEWLGHGFSTSWPNDWPTPPFVRLDHALVGPGVIPTAVDDIDVPGSDHRGFVVDLALGP